MSVSSDQNKPVVSQMVKDLKLECFHACVAGYGYKMSLISRSLTYWFCLSHSYVNVELPFNMLHRISISIFCSMGD
ncbi:hypothetical protein CsSME_00032412 [Camellia sinensis var. sinensis]